MSASLQFWLKQDVGLLILLLVPISVAIMLVMNGIKICIREVWKYVTWNRRK